MDAALLLARLIVAAVFAIAAATKVADVRGWRQAVVGFGVPRRAAPWVAALVPVAEAAIAIALLPAATAWYGALGAVALLAAFVVGIAANLARGRRPDCHCFGQLHSAPVGWRTIARNVALAAPALLVVVHGPGDPGPSAVRWVGDLETIEALTLVGAAVAFALIALEGVLILQLLRQHGRLLLRLDALETAHGGVPSSGSGPAPAGGLAVGSPAPDFALPTPDGDMVTLNSLRSHERPVLLVFSDPSCGPCGALLPHLGRWQREHGDRLTIALVSRGGSGDHSVARRHGVNPVLLQRDREVAAAYRASGTPSAVLVTADGRIASGVAPGADAIEQLVAKGVASGLPPIVQVARLRGDSAPTAAVGQPAPDVELPDLEGHPRALAEFRGRELLVVFWNPGCGFCRAMTDDLRAWERNRPDGGPQLVVVSQGTIQDNRALQLDSPVLLDNDSRTARAFGARGTPTAVRLDPDGRVASGVAMGARAILELAEAGSSVHS